MHLKIKFKRQLLALLTLFYMGFWRYVITWGDQNDSPYQTALKRFKLGKKACFGKILLFLSMIYAFEG